MSARAGRAMMPRALGSAAIVVALAAASCAAGGGKAPSTLYGTWTFVGDDSVIATVPNVGVQRLAGTSIRIADGPSGPELDVGCLCHIPLKLTNDSAVLGNIAGTVCELLVFSYDIRATSQSWSLTLDEAGTMQIHGEGSALLEAQIAMVDFTLSGQLQRREDLVPHCAGDKETAVGVFLPVGQCPTGTGMEGLFFFMDDEKPGCNVNVDGRGATFWVDPETAKPLAPCEYLSYSNTYLPFCRVDGDIFHPFAQDPRGGAAYALLQLGGHCPDGSVAVVKHISNETVGNGNYAHGINIAPNQSVSSDYGTFTELHFCLFEPRPAEAGVQTEFPDLGIAYAVFHDFDGFQPPWVISKNWLLTEDAFNNNHNAYDPPAGASTDELKTMIEDYRRALPDGEHVGTFFDAARVH